MSSQGATSANSQSALLDFTRQCLGETHQLCRDQLRDSGEGNQSRDNRAGGPLRDRWMERTEGEAVVTHPDAGLCEVGPDGDLLAGAHVRVAVPLEGGLQLLQLLAGEVGPLPPLLLLQGAVLRAGLIQLVLVGLLCVWREGGRGRGGCLAPGGSCFYDVCRSNVFNRGFYRKWQTVNSDMCC